MMILKLRSMIQKNFVLMDIESMIGEFSENDFDENAPTLEEFIQSVKDQTEPTILWDFIGLVTMNLSIWNFTII